MIQTLLSLFAEIIVHSRQDQHQLILGVECLCNNSRIVGCLSGLNIADYEAEPPVSVDPGLSQRRHDLV
ncbi:Uncharacterised protein [Mycobacteroides abscessus subsp. abscessus]|nr:Uncharacterised protein [Mycobacteroides abscessus subsp. abscessus]